MTGSARFQNFAKRVGDSLYYSLVVKYAGARYKKKKKNKIKEVY